MPTLPGMEGDVYFGDAERPLPDWRKDLPEDEDDSDELTPEERKAIAGMIGFDPGGAQEKAMPKADPRAVQAAADLLANADDEDWALAVLSAALDEAEGDLGAAVEAATQALQKHPKSAD